MDSAKQSNSSKRVAAAAERNSPMNLSSDCRDVRISHLLQMCIWFHSISVGQSVAAKTHRNNAGTLNFLSRLVSVIENIKIETHFLLIATSHIIWLRWRCGESRDKKNREEFCRMNKKYTLQGLIFHLMFFFFYCIMINIMNKQLLCFQRCFF